MNNPRNSHTLFQVAQGNATELSFATESSNHQKNAQTTYK